jgi:hypothetical protein
MIYGSPIIDQIRIRGGVDPDRIVAKPWRKRFEKNLARIRGKWRSRQSFQGRADRQC